MDKDKIVNEKIGLVHTITIKCPLDMRCTNVLKSYIKSTFGCRSVKKNDGEMYVRIPVVDFYNIFDGAYEYCTMSKTPEDGLVPIMSVVETFPNLKYVSILFTTDPEIMDIYSKEVSADTIQEIFSVNLIEIILSDKLHQDTIDIINKSMVFNDLIPNEYLKRKFVIDFKFDEYISYISMVINNNPNYFNSAGGDDVIEFLNAFPNALVEGNPKIRIITNYSSL